MSKEPKQERPWQELIPGTFGNQDRIFAGHSLDEERAKAAIKAAKKAGVTRDDFEKELLWDVYKNVKSHTVFWELVENQNKKLKKMWK